MAIFTDVLPHIQKEEDSDLRRFADFLFGNGIQKITVLDKPDRTKKNGCRQGNFDYLLQIEQSGRLAVEFTRLYGTKEQIKKLHKRVNLVEAFMQEQQRHLSKHGTMDFQGLWNVEDPENFGATLTKSKRIAHENFPRLVSAIKEKRSTIEIAGCTLRLRQAGFEQSGRLYFMMMTMIIERSADFESSLRDMLSAKNEQLTVEGAERVLVIINKHGVHESNTVIGALSKVAEIWHYSNFDKIYFEQNAGYFVLIFSKELRDAWISNALSFNHSFIKPFQLWISHLRDSDPSRFFVLTRGILTGNPHEIFPDSRVRENLVRIGEWLTEQGRYEDVTWLIDRFIDDPDPEEPGSLGDHGLRYHKDILLGEDIPVSETVLGNLAWVIQKLALHIEYVNTALDYTKKLASHKNMYVKLHAILPLVEIAIRRRYLKSYGKTPRQGAYKDFHDLAFNLLRVVEENPRCLAIANRLCRVFCHYIELSTGEAERVLDALKITREAAGIFVSYCVLNRTTLVNLDARDDGGKLDKRLREIIIAKSDKYRELRARIVWMIFQALDQNPSDFDAFRPYIDLCLEQQYSTEFYNRIELILSFWIRKRPDICIHWFRLMLKQVSYVAESESQVVARGGIWLLYAESIIEAVAMERPSELAGLMKNLVTLWKSRVWIGDLRRLFESYRLVSDKKRRTEIRSEFQLLYDSVNLLHPNACKVDWD